MSSPIVHSAASQTMAKDIQSQFRKMFFCFSFIVLLISSPRHQADFVKKFSMYSLYTLFSHQLVLLQLLLVLCTYLDTIVHEQWDYSQEITSRIEKARAVYTRMSSLFKSHDLTINTKMKLLRCYVFSCLLYTSTLRSQL